MLRPPLSIRGLRTRGEASVKEFLNGWVLQAEDEKEAKKRLHNLLNFSLGGAPKYPDKTAVHFATQLVANDYYGGERNNEVFFIFPSDFLASQYSFAFNGGQKDFTKPQSETKWNDVFIWPGTLDNPGISLDTGFVFLPEKTPVDPNSGSKYASEIKNIDGKEQRVLIEDTDLIQSFYSWGRNLNDESPIMKAYRSYSEERDYFRRQDLEISCLDTFRQEIEKLGFGPDASEPLARSLFVKLHHLAHTIPELLEDMVKESGAGWKRAEDTIPSKEYWEDYFRKNPHLRPKHIVYYDGDPTR